MLLGCRCTNSVPSSSPLYSLAASLASSVGTALKQSCQSRLRTSRRGTESCPNSSIVSTSPMQPNEDGTQPFLRQLMKKLLHLTRPSTLPQENERTNYSRACSDPLVTVPGIRGRRSKSLTLLGYRHRILWAVRL